MMKKIISIIVAAVLMFSSAATVFAANPATTQVTVTISKTLSIVITGGPLDFGTLGVGTTAVSAGAISVKNDGSGADETMKLTVGDPTGWTQGTPASEVYRVSFQFKDTKPTAGDANWKLPAAIAETLAYDATGKLWAKLETPTSTAKTAKQTITLTITAE